jgi:hypothetical protein
VKHPDMTKPNPKKPAKVESPAKPAAFDLWLKRGLHQMYDTVASEPIPEEWLKLIEEDRQK